MRSYAEPWDYLILTASNDLQAAAYEQQLQARHRLRLLGGARQTLVVADPDGRRVGSGGSTICCLLAVLNRELASRGGDRARPELWADVLRQLRILIIHAGGDSRRLPAYGPCGKVFVPLPGASDSALGTTLFDRQLPVYLNLPPLENGAGQVTIAAGDVLLGFAPEQVSFASCGITGLGCSVSAEQASGHGVYCLGSGGQVRRFLQKPSLAEQLRQGADNGYGRSVLDIGVFSFNALTAVSLLQMCQVQPDAAGCLGWQGPLGVAIVERGLDFYREICCALGTESTWESYRSAVYSSGSTWDEALLERVFQAVSPIACQVQVLRHCDFLHFGTTRQIINSGQELLRRDEAFSPPQSCVSINNRLTGRARLVARNAWVEGCSIEDQLTLGGENVLVGVDIREPLELPPGACLDVLPGKNRGGQAVSFIRCYHKDDPFHNAPAATATLCGYPLSQWLAAAGAEPDEVWEPSLPHDRRTGWNARLFPAEDHPGAYRRWLWMFEPRKAAPAEFLAWRRADRYCLEELAALADQEAFHQRRVKIRSEEIRRSLRRCFSRDSGFSVADLAYILADSSEPEVWLAELLAEARWHWDHGAADVPDEAFIFSRIMHSLGSALLAWIGEPAAALPPWFLGLVTSLAPADAKWLAELKLYPDASWTTGQWAARARKVAFEYLRREIVGSGSRAKELPVNALRSDEIVWGRAPARLDLAGGWTDTPPFTLEHGGGVLNAAVLLNDQPPVQVFARLTPEPLIRLGSIDLGTHLAIRQWSDLLDYVTATGEFSLVKAALALSGFSPEASGESPEESLHDRLVRFGAGLELTTLAAIPKGSGLGTSSIMGAALLAVIHRVMGRRLSPTELFHGVLRLEQTLTTGGGWQDQIGGAVGGLKLITTQPGIVPEATIHYVPADVLDPKSNGKCTLLYYTGITRLAKNILEEVVGRYLDRDREAASTLRHIRNLAPQMAEAMARKDLPTFGRLIQIGWQLKQQLDPNSTTAEIESLLSRIGRHLYGATLLGAGGGGFLLLVCKSDEDANRLRTQLESDPPNPRARFFDFAVSSEGLSLSVC
jgi:galactokinase/mevalonate kinase-like predicted kinase